MKKFFEHLFSSYSSAVPDSGEGIPYWLFWLLLSFIFLLVFFIFLRDKELRRKLDHFFFHTKKRLIRLRHQRRLRRETAKRERLIKDMGQKAWEERVDVPGGKEIFDGLIDLEDRKKGYEDELKLVEAKITALKTNQEDISKKLDANLNGIEKEKNPCVEKLLSIKEREKKIEIDVIQKNKELENAVRTLNAVNKELRELEEEKTVPPEEQRLKADKSNQKKNELTVKKNRLDQEINSLVEEGEILGNQRKQHERTLEKYEREIHKIETEKKQHVKEHQKEIKEWERKKEKTVEKTDKLESDKTPLFQSYGELIEKERVAHPMLEILYAQTDRSRERIEEIERQIQALD